MDTSTGHLVTPDRLEEIRQLDAQLAADYTEVPERLSRAARKKLAGRESAMVSLTSGGKLSKWAAQERAKSAKNARRVKAKRKTRRRMEKATRRSQRS